MLCGYVLFVCALIATSVAEECVTYDFEDNFNDVFNFAPICQTIVATRWSQIAYVATTVQSPHELSTRAIIPGSRESCTSSFPFTLQAGGTLQVNVFMRSSSVSDNINVMVYQKMASGADRAVRGASWRNIFGFNTLNITIPEMETFEGYFILTGTSGFGSTVLVDSFRYLPPGMNESVCVIYGGEPYEPTEDPITELTEEPITEPTPPSPGHVQEVCTSTRFLRSEFEKFDQKGTVCRMLSEWTWMEYDLPGVTPIETSESFISSDRSASCISSFDFDMRTDGILEVNVFLNGTGNQLIVSVHRSAGDGSYSLVVQEEHINSTEGNWFTLNISLPRNDDIAVFKGHVTLKGNAAGAKTLLVDSFRFYSPGNEDNCTIYSPEDEGPLRELCTTSYFNEEDFETFDRRGAMCRMSEDWIHNNDNNLETFISPKGTFVSCTSSLDFDMRTDGVLEIKLQMEGDGNSLIVTVYRTDDNGMYIPIAEESYTTKTEGKWYTLEILLPRSENIDIFKGHITFLGRASVANNVKVDSFRFYTPESKDNCTIYDEEVTPPEEVCTTSQLSKDDFEEIFNRDDMYCTAMIDRDWGWLESLSGNVPFETSEPFIYPDTLPSCISTYNFKMRTDVILEVKLFMKGGDDLLRVLVFDTVDSRIPIVTTDHTERTLNQEGYDDWHILKIPLPLGGGDIAVFNGRITLIGIAAEPNSVLVDSFRFYSPASERNCVPFPEVCVVSQISEDYAKFSQREAFCTIFGKWEMWSGELESAEILTPGSLTPQTIMSCISSFDFNMRMDGTLELKLFMSANDRVQVTVYRNTENGLHTPIAVAERTTLTRGWELLTIDLPGGDDITIFKGHVTLMGRVSEHHAVLVESFRFFTPKSEDCPAIMEPEPLTHEKLK